MIRLGKKGIVWSLTSFSALLIPFLYGISRLTGSELTMVIGGRISLVSILYLWCVYLAFRRGKTRRRMAAAVSLLLAILLGMAINGNLTGILATPLVDGWDMAGAAVLCVSAVALLVLDKKGRRG